MGRVECRKSRTNIQYCLYTHSWASSAAVGHHWLLWVFVGLCGYRGLALACAGGCRYWLSNRRGKKERENIPGYPYSSSPVCPGVMVVGVCCRCTCQVV